MKLTNSDLVKEFYDRIEGQYPELTEEQVRDIVFAPWRFLKSEMETGDLPEIRIKYFGTFQVYKGRAVNMLRNLEKRFKFHKVDTLQYQKLTTMLNRYLNRFETDK